MFRFKKLKSLFVRFFFFAGIMWGTVSYSSLANGSMQYEACGNQLFDENGQPEKALCLLMDALGMDVIDESKPALNQINDWAQKNLLRKRERWEQSDRFDESRSSLFPLLVELGFVHATSPRDEFYQGAIVHGSLFEAVQQRLQYLIKHWNMGVRFNELYFLGSERPLEEFEIQSFGKIVESNLPLTENEMIQFIWKHADVPAQLRKEVPVYFVSAPMKEDPINFKFHCPSTDDAVKEWLKKSPVKGCYLAISNAPHTKRQDLVMRTLAPEDYSFDTIGPAAHEQEKMAIFLDEVARAIYQTKRLMEKLKILMIDKNFLTAFSGD